MYSISDGEYSDIVAEEGNNYKYNSFYCCYVFIVHMHVFT